MDTVEDIVKRLNALRKRFPKSPKVARFVVEDSRDSMNEPALYIWVLLENDTPDSDRAWEKLQPIDRMIADAIFETKDPRYPYVRFQTEAEHEEMLNSWK